VKISAQEVEQRQILLEIEVEDERVNKALDDAYKRIVNRINVPGFRRGRAPRPLVERMVGREALLEDAVEHLVPQVYEDALKEQQITASGQPSLEVTSTEPLQFKAKVPLQPKVDLGDYKSIDVPLDPIIVEDTEVEAVVDNLRDSNGTWVPVERPAKIGDRVGFDVTAQRDGRQVMDQKDAEFILNPEGAEPAPGFSEQLVGLSAGDQKTFTVGQESTSEEESASYPLTEFSVSLHWVKEKELPSADDEFAKSVSDKETIEALRDEIREQIRRRRQAGAREKQREQIVKEAIERSTVEAPPQAIERQANQILESMAASLDRQGISIEQYLQFSGKDEQAFRAELLAEGEQALKRSVVLASIAEAEGVEVGEDDVRREIELAASSADNPARAARQALARPETRARIEAILRARKGADRLFELTGAADEPEPSDQEASETPGEVNV
jgi:trigger factor